MHNDSWSGLQENDRTLHKHRTIDRVTRIVEEVVYNPGMTFADLARALDAPRSSVHGFIRGLLANGWLYEDKHRFYLGPAVYSLNIASGHIRAGLVTHADLEQLHRKSGVTVFLGVRVGEHVIYIDEAGTDSLTGFAARSNIRRTLLATAGGKVLLASRPQAERDAYLRRRGAEEAELVERILGRVRQHQENRDRPQHAAQGKTFRDCHRRVQPSRRCGGGDHARRRHHRRVTAGTGTRQVAPRATSSRGREGQ